MTVAAPSAPYKLAAAASAAGVAPVTVSLLWNEASNNEAGFIIERARDARFTRELTALAAGVNSTSFVDGTVLPRTAYFYRMKAATLLASPLTPTWPA